jgi:hypothetical protein
VYIKYTLDNGHVQQCSYNKSAIVIKRAACVHRHNTASKTFEKARMISKYFCVLCITTVSTGTLRFLHTPFCWVPSPFPVLYLHLRPFSSGWTPLNRAFVSVSQFVTYLLSVRKENTRGLLASCVTPLSLPAYGRLRVARTESDARFFELRLYIVPIDGLREQKTVNCVFIWLSPVVSSYNAVVSLH